MKHGTHIFERSLDFVVTHYRPGSFDPRRGWESLAIDSRAARRRRFIAIASAAAIVVLIAGIAIRLLRPHDPIAGNAIVTAATGPAVCYLPDSTRVVLPQGASLAYDPLTYAEARHVTVSGGAGLSVSRDPAHPFSVAIENVTVTVLGTVFEVSAEGTDSVSVSVTSGRVRVANPSGDAVLTRGMTAMAVPGRVEVTGGQLTLQLDGVDMPLSELVARLDSDYSLTVTGLPDGEDPRLTFSMSGTPDELAAMIGALISVKVEIIPKR